MPDRDYVFDAVSLSNFCLSESMDLLAMRYGKRLLLTSEVLDEINDGVAAGYTALDQVSTLLADRAFREVGLTAEERGVYVTLLNQLGSGEASCIAAGGTRGAVVVTDDRAARNCCGDRRIAFTGTLGVLKAACEDGSISGIEADAILARMIACGFYSPVARVTDLLD
jgi:predicted nucleic acid-binding protein